MFLHLNVTKRPERKIGCRKQKVKKNKIDTDKQEKRVHKAPRVQVKYEWNENESEADSVDNTKRNANSNNIREKQINESQIKCDMKNMKNVCHLSLSSEFVWCEVDAIQLFNTSSAWRNGQFKILAWSYFISVFSLFFSFPVSIRLALSLFAEWRICVISRNLSIEK